MMGCFIQSCWTSHPQEPNGAAGENGGEGSETLSDPYGTLSDPYGMPEFVGLIVTRMRQRKMEKGTYRSRRVWKLSYCHLACLSIPLLEWTK